MEQDSTFMSSLMNYFFQKTWLKNQNCRPYNHQFLQVEHGIKSLSNILTKHLTGQGQMWHKYLHLAFFAYSILTPPTCVTTLHMT